MNTSSNVVTETPKLVTPYCSKLSGDKVCLLVHASTSLGVIPTDYKSYIYPNTDPKLYTKYDWTIHNLRQQPTFSNATTGLPTKWRLRNESRNSIVTTRHHLDVGGASDWLKQISHAAQPIRSPTHSDASLLWNFCALFQDVISCRNQWRRCKMSAVFQGLTIQRWNKLKNLKST